MSDTLKLSLMHPLLVVGDVKMPSASLPGYGKLTADCHFGITGDFFINGIYGSSHGRHWNINVEISAASTFMIVTVTITITSSRFS